MLRALNGLALTRLCFLKLLDSIHPLNRNETSGCLVAFCRVVWGGCFDKKRRIALVVGGGCWYLADRTDLLVS